jgi:hypothetical protein
MLTCSLKVHTTVRSCTKAILHCVITIALLYNRKIKNTDALWVFTNALMPPASRLHGMAPKLLLRILKKRSKGVGSPFRHAAEFKGS